MPMMNVANPVFAAIFMIFATAPSFVSAQSTGGADSEAEGTLDENGLAMGTTADQVRQPGDTYVRETFGDWSLRCIVVQDGDDPCQMYQLLTDGAGQPVAEFTMFKLPEGGQAAAGATVVVPLETSLLQQLSIKVDDNPGRRYPYAFCNEVGCYARIGLTGEDVDSYKAGAEATVSLVPALDPSRRPINLIMSLSGFTAAFNEASVLEQ